VSCRVFIALLRSRPAENLTTQGYGEQFLRVQTELAARENRRVAIRRITPLLAKEPTGF
jgi:outer membrane protein OmpA-like peptidoglycan-associated protein